MQKKCFERRGQAMISLKDAGIDGNLAEAVDKLLLGKSSLLRLYSWVALSI